MSDTASLSNRIFYCEQCGLRIPPDEFKHNRATVNADGIAYCGACHARGDALASAVAVPQNVPAQNHAPAAAPSHAAIAATKSARRTTQSHTHSHSHGGHARPGAKSESLPWKPAIAGAVVVGTLLGAFAISRSKPETVAETKREPPKPVETRVVEPKRVEPAPAPVRPTTTPSVAVVPQPVQPTPPAATEVVRPPPAKALPVDDYDPRKMVAESLLKQAREFQQKNPDDVYGFRDKLQQLVERYRGTASADEAGKLLAEIKLPAVDPNSNPELPPDAEWAKAVSIVPKADAGKDQLNGNWSLNNGSLRSDKSMWAKLGLPYILPKEYDIRLTFTRHDNDCLLVVLGRRGKPFIFSIGSGNQHVSFEDVREKRKDVVSTKLSRPGIFSGSRHQIVIQVRREALRGYLNGKLLVGCQVDDDGLSLRPEMQMPQPNQLGLMTWDTVYEFHSIEVLPLKGEGKLLR